MIDTHCHLLPGLDDGPPDSASSLELAGALVAQGVTQVVCTPHFSRRYPVEHRSAAEALERLRHDLERAEVPLELHLGAEATPQRAVEEIGAQLQLRAIAGRFLLVEIAQPTPLSALRLVQTTLAGYGLTTVLGHPERARTVQRNPEMLRTLRDGGALVQVVAPSLLGRWGPETAATAWELIDRGLVDLLASDAHGHRRRRPHLREAADRVAQRYGDDARVELTERAPRELLEHDHAPREL